MSNATNADEPSLVGLMAVVICGPTPSKSGVATTNCQSSSTRSAGASGGSARTAAHERARAKAAEIARLRNGGIVDSRALAGRWDNGLSARQVELDQPPRGPRR